MGTPVIIRDGTTGCQARVSPTKGLRVAEVGTRVITGSYFAATGTLIVGSAGAQTLISIENPRNSEDYVFIKRFGLRGAPVAATVTAFLYHLTRATGLPTGGATIILAQKHARTDLNANAIVRTVPTGLTPVPGDIWTGWPGATSNQSLVVQPLPDAINNESEVNDIVLSPGECIYGYADVNTADWRHWAQIYWQEGNGFKE
jgi:hypothetical protein